jgi:hypothetical protein
MLDRLATSADEYLDATNHVWCCETQEVSGLTTPRRSRALRPGRACYTSAIKSV